MATWEDYRKEEEEEECIQKKHIKIIIHGSAKHYKDVPENVNPEDLVDFDKFVNEIFCAHKDELMKIFNSVYGLEGNSVDKEFSFDSVEKQIR